LKSTPAVAAWLWCMGNETEDQWDYRNDKAVLDRMWLAILEKTQFRWDTRSPNDDDEFDAAVGYILGHLHVSDPTALEQKVIILGDRSTGSFLLPAVRGLECSWKAWINKQRTRVQPPDHVADHPDDARPGIDQGARQRVP